MLPHEEAFFGGAAGGGKSDGLLMGALQFADIPGYSALILRRTFQDLAEEGAIMNRAEAWLTSTDAKPHGPKKWSFPSGAVLKFGHMVHEKSKYNYQSSEYDFIGFDEATQFTGTQLSYMFSRLRKVKDSPVPFVRYRPVGNPGGVGHDYIFNRYIGKDGKGFPDMPFIPSRLKDNPSLDYDDYVRQLMKLDPITRAQLLNGDWNIRAEGNLFKRSILTSNLINGYPITGSQFCRYWDFAATKTSKVSSDPDWTVGLLGCLDEQNLFYIIDVVRFRGTPAEVEKNVKATALDDGRDIPVVIEQEGGASGKITIDNYQRNILLGYKVVGVSQSKDKTTRAAPVSAYAENGNMKIVRADWNNEYISELVAFPNPDIHDDQADATSGCFNYLTLNTEETEETYVYDERARISPF